MKVEIDMSEQAQAAYMTFFIDEFKVPKDYVVALSFIYAISADFELAPELEVEDLLKMIEDFKEQGKDKFKFEIAEDGIEIDLE